jgi:hypothetical protein
MVRLVCGESELYTSIQQAEGIFHIQKETNITSWQLPGDSPYQLVNGRIVKRTGSGTVQKSAKKKRD